MDVKSLIFVLAIMLFSGMSNVEASESENVGANVPEKEVSFEIRASIPSSIDIEVTRGKDGIDLFDVDGRLKCDVSERSFGFKIRSTLKKIKLSFSGSAGLSYVIDQRGRYWSLQHKEDKDEFIPLSLIFSSGEKSGQMSNICEKKGIFLERTIGDETERFITVSSMGSSFVAGDYSGKLIVKIAAAE